MSHPYCISIFQIHHIDYPSQGFAKLKYSDSLSPIVRRDPSHLDLHTNFISTWLYLVAFRHCIRNADSSTSKYSELFTNHYGDLRTEGHLCPYASWVAFDNKALSKWVTCSVTMYFYILLVCHTSVSTLFGYEDNQFIWHIMTDTR